MEREDSEREVIARRARMASRTMVYSPEAAILHPGRMVRDMWSDVRASRGLAWRLAQRDMRAQYRGSFLGYAWAFILPLANTLVWIFLNRTGIVQVSDTDIPYPVYVFTGTMLWQLFTEALGSPIVQLTSARIMMAKLNFPREALVLSGIIKLLASAGIKFIILIPAVIIMGVMPDWHLLLFPLAACSLMLAGIALGLVVAPIGMLYQDIARAIPIVSQFLMYITPVVFPIPAEGFTAQVLKLNILSPLMVTARAWLTGSGTDMLGYFLVVSFFFLILLGIGWVLYRITIPVLIERVSS